MGKLVAHEQWANAAEVPKGAVWTVMEKLSTAFLCYGGKCFQRM